MTESSEITFTRPELDRLQRLRASARAFQNGIAALPADEQSNAHNEQFNQLQLEAKALLNDRGFDKKVSRAITEDMLAYRSQRVILPRLSGIVILGVILALVGLGVNSIILEDPIVNSLGCCVSSGGMLLVLGAFGVLGMTNYRRRLTNYGDLYQRCNTLLYEIDHTLNMAIPSLADRPQEAVDVPEISSVVELALDSLDKQAADWQQKLQALEEQRLTLGPDAPMELTLNIDFAQRELNRVRQEIDRLTGRAIPAAETAEAAADSSLKEEIVIPTAGEMTPTYPGIEPGDAQEEIVTPTAGYATPTYPGAEPGDAQEEIITPAAREIARANTAEMPVFKTDEAEDSEAKDTPPDE